MTIYAEVNGAVERISADKHGIQIRGQWYNNKFKTADDLHVGDTVVLTVKDGKFWNKYSKGGVGAKAGSAAITAPPTIAIPAKPAFPIAEDDKSRAIIRQNALGNAVKLIDSIGIRGVTDVDLEKMATRAIEIARIFEAYTSGDIERVMADASLMDELEAMQKASSLIEDAK